MELPEFKDKKLLQQALTHSSYAKENGVSDNERLEFLGDSIIEFVVRDLLFTKYPMMDEGEMSKRSDLIVDQAQLASIAVSLGLPDLLRLGSGSKTEKDNPSVQADAFEALIGAYYLDAEIIAVCDYAKMIFRPLVNRALDLSPTDSVSAFQEYVQANFGGQLPEYRELSVIGPDHAKTFEIAVYINHERYGVGQGHSKKEARKQAASNALYHLQPDPVSKLQEYAQARFGQRPEYREVSITTSLPNQSFEIEVYLHDQCYGVGEGRSKKEARKQAALAALHYLKIKK
ncbi:MAG: ribonuclease III [Leptolyngbya sp.]|nr:ribonuclease III [Leptolyngbya sp.]